MLVIVGTLRCEERAVSLRNQALTLKTPPGKVNE